MAVFDVNQLIDVAKGEIGYFEKKSNSQLNNKTGNVGSNNWTKYGAYFGINPAAWCDLWNDWCFVQAFGRDNAKMLLGGFSAYTPDSAQYYKKMGRWHTSPKVGDQIFFKNSVRICHTGIVYRVTSSTVYTIEGNTSGVSGVIANGGCVCYKSYAINNTRIAGYGRPNYNGDPISSAINTSTHSYLMKGDKGIAVKDMQIKLIACGYSCGECGADGDFGSSTDSALRKFQKAKKLVVDGKFGSLSKTALDKAYAQAIATKPILTKNKINTVSEVQNWLNYTYSSGLKVDNVYGQNTKKALVKALQEELNNVYKTGLVEDGIYGTKTKSVIKDHVTIKSGSKGSIVKVLQALLICNGQSSACVDGDCGSGTVSAIKSYQGSKGLTKDGCAGVNTFTKLCS